MIFLGKPENTGIGYCSGRLGKTL